MENENEHEKQASRAASLLGSRGGNKTLKTHGKEQYSNMGKKSAEVRRMGKDLSDRLEKVKQRNKNDN